MFKRKRLLVTHNGPFHADDVFAAATLSLYLKKQKLPWKLVRTRDEKMFQKGDFVFDVGGIYKAEHNRFDHHQRGGAGERENGMPYAAFGLVWRHYGEAVSGSAEIWREIDEDFVTPIDAHDTGHIIYEPLNRDITPVEISHVVAYFNSTWKEDTKNNDKHFLMLVSVATEILSRLIKKTCDKVEGRQHVEEAYNSARNKEIIVLDQYWPWHGTLKHKPDTIYAVYPHITGAWHVQTVEAEMFKPRKALPEAWAGQPEAELQKISGVSDAIFAHPKRFLAGAKSREGAIALAKKALNS
jgi:uncharacterized UPF0160 family protein